MIVDDNEDEFESNDSDGGDDFSDDFGDDFSDDFGDDFSDDLSEENVGFGEDAATDFEDETVVYDEEADSGGDSPFAQAAVGGLQEYKKYIVMAFSITIVIVFGVLMMGKKKPDASNSTLPPVVSNRGYPTTPKDTPIPTSRDFPQPKMRLSSLDDMKNKLERAKTDPASMDSMMVSTRAASSKQIDRIVDETKRLGERMTEFQAHFESNRDSFGKLNTTIGMLEKSLREANSTLIKLDEKMAKLKEDLSKQHTMLSKLDKKKNKVKHKGMGMEMVSLPEYHLYAAIPGRAWLKSESGTTITIAVGSKVPGYGKVSLIEPIKGVVVTDSGHIFRFAER